MIGSSIERRVGLIGYPLRHSISPAFQQAAFDALAIPAHYVLWETPQEELASLVARLRQAEYLGANVTIPYKQAVLPYLDHIDEKAVLVGAVNTIVRTPDGLLGYNTDVFGFADSLRLDGAYDTRGGRVVVLGAGGAARGVVAALLYGGAAVVTVAARRVEQAEGLLRDLRSASVGTLLEAVPLARDGPALAMALAEAELLVNATPIGTAHRRDVAEVPIDPRLLHPGLLVCDLVYNPPETMLLREAGNRGSRTLNGLPMLVYQGAAAFELWTGQAAPIALMRSRALEALRV